MALSIVSCMQEYVRTMLDRVSGMKVLVLDKETTSIMSLLFTQTQILEKEVFLVEKIDSEKKEKMRHLNAICFLRPTADNFLRLAKELKSPSYNEYHIFFSNVVPHTQLERLARCDEFDVVHQVHEFYADLYAVNHDLFSLNIPSTVGLCQDPSAWSPYEETVVERTLDGLFACCLALRRRPVIRFQRNSDVCKRLAHKLQQKVTEEHTLFDSMGLAVRGGDYSAGGGGCVLLIVDRREDPVTPLLNQWTYQAMVHELIGIESNRVSMKKAPGVAKELEEIVMAAHQDTFYEQNMTANFGDLGVAIKRYVESYQQQTKNNARIESIEDMQRFVDQYPEFKKLSGNVSKHVAVVHELSRLVEAHGLLDVSALEQDLACAENRAEHLKAVLDKLRSPRTPNMERLRLVLLFALRYENDSYIGQLKDELRKAGIDDEQVSLVDVLLSYAGAHVRGGDLFGNKNIFTAAKAAMARGIKGVQNVFTQHKTVLSHTLSNLTQGRLKESSYPFVMSGMASSPAAASKDKPNEAIVFMVGGCTYEEARDVSLLNQQGGTRIILGGTYVHNTRTFLADVAQLVRSRKQFAQIDIGATGHDTGGLV